MNLPSKTAAGADDLQRDISARAFAPEPEVLAGLLKKLKPLEALEPEIMAGATALAKELREEGGSQVESFLHEYGLSTQEGIAIMCLAEALLRIPDAETANRLIVDKLGDREWQKHLGKSDSLFVNAASWGLLLTGKTIDLAEYKGKTPLRAISALVDKLGEPVIREVLKQAMEWIGGQFVLGETIEGALKRAKKYEAQGYRFSYDMLGEGARTDAQAQAYLKAYLNAVKKIGSARSADRASHQPPKAHPIASEGARAGDIQDLYSSPGISVKLSALHPRYLLAQEKRVLEELLPRLKEIITEAQRVGVAIAIDAEESWRLDIEMRLFKELLADPAFKGFGGIGFVVQAYGKRAVGVIEFLAKLSKETGRKIPLRLVKGAYWDSEIKWSQVGGFPGFPVFTHKEHTDVSYLACALTIMENAACFYPQFATHNARTVSSILVLAKKHNVSLKDFEFQRLHGMGEALHARIVKDVACRIYAPVGAHKDLLAYLIRRLLENGANTSFVNLLMDKDTPLEELLEDPVKKTMENKAMHNPDIRLPEDLYGDVRKNSMGVDFGNLAARETLMDAFVKFKDTKWEAKPLIARAVAGTAERADNIRILHEPADTSRQVGTVREATKEEIEAALSAAHEAFESWSKTPVKERADTLRTLGDLIEKHGGEFIALAAREAGKNLSDGVAEVREAADFCRYYAWQAETLMAEESLDGPTGESNTLRLEPRGVFACVSPWNFPLAIFTGQVTAALATGNCIIAKPAGQTPLIAARAVELMHEAGFPKAVVQLLPGGGGTVGQALLEDSRTSGVVFTGSTDTAWHINRTLAAKKGPIAPLIAETGGQNCMVVDSSALLEQAADDIVLSAFGSAGQRCSALRVLFAQEDIADELIHMLKGAMAELSLGYPLEFSTDIGPVIDAKSKDVLVKHIEKMKAQATLIAAAPLPETLAAQGHFVAPHAFEIPSIGMLEGEVFGPVLHVVRFKASEMEKVASDINSTGFGLTFGLHSRIEDHVEFFKTRIKAGNMYVNRSMTGAVVGVQPFGGEGLSGTGPKAGGPHYLLRFLNERTLTVNTAAMGGDVRLLGGKDKSA